MRILTSVAGASQRSLTALGDEVSATVAEPLSWDQWFTQDQGAQLFRLAVPSSGGHPQSPHLCERSPTMCELTLLNCAGWSWGEDGILALDQPEANHAFAQSDLGQVSSFPKWGLS